MKALKISLAVIVVSAIAFFIIRSLVTINKPIVISLPKNPFTVLIDKEIESLIKLPDSKFCKDAFDNVKYLIDENYKPNPPKYPFGRLGNSQLENNQSKENFTRNLYSAYAAKFINQSFYVFKGKEWKIEDLRFINSEFQTLRKYILLEKDSPVDKKFKEIQTIFSKYDEIAGFISNSNSFSYLDTRLSDRFPISDVQEKLAQAVTYQNNRLGNDYVNNCIRLHNGLKEIPQTLFRAHINYLDNKISQWSGMYSNFSSQKDYVDNLYKPLKSEIDALDNTVYNVVNFDSEYKRLTDRWSADNTKAYNYSYSSTSLK